MNQKLKIAEKSFDSWFTRFGAALTLFALSFFSLCATAQPSASSGPHQSNVSAGSPITVTPATLKSFAMQKEIQARSLASSPDELPSEFKSFYSAIQEGNWEAASNDYNQIKFWVTASPIYHKSWWQPVLETFGAEDQFHNGAEKYFNAYANGIIQSIPPGAIYFGGTDPGRFIITAAEKSQIIGSPFFTITQNALADATDLNYLRSMYGEKIYIPTTRDSQKCFQVYYQDVQDRMRKGQLQPGELATIDPVTGKLRVTGQVAVMAINALLARIIFDRNPDREFYIEESFPLAWMYPYLEPHGLIFKLNRQPLARLSDGAVQRDHDYWVKVVAPMIGDWLNNETSVTDVSAFAEKIFVRHDFSGFAGDTNFVQNANSYRMFSKERCSIAGLYAWRAGYAAGAVERQRMYNEADFAFRQSLALCPDLPEAVFRYVQFLTQTNRFDDALTVAKTCLSVDPTNALLPDLIRNLEQFKKTAATRPHNQSQALAMEAKARANPSDNSNIFSLAGYYLKMDQTNRATQIVKQTLSRPDASAEVLRAAAHFFASIGDYTNLATTLKKLMMAVPKSPETRFDLARLQARLGEDDEAIKNLRIAIELGDMRLRANPDAFDIRAAARAAADFNSLRDRGDFQTLVSP